MIILDQQVLDAGGCAFFLVNPIYRRYSLQTVIDYMDTGSFYGARYDGWSDAAALWYDPWQRWIGYGYSNQRAGAPGR